MYAIFLSVRPFVHYSRERERTSLAQPADILGIPGHGHMFCIKFLRFCAVRAITAGSQSLGPTGNFQASAKRKTDIWTDKGVAEITKDWPL